MTREDLDDRYAEASWLINKRTAAAGLKALTIGWESLDALTNKIADIYELSADDRKKVRPIKSIDMTDMAGAAASTAKAAAGTATAVNAVKIVKAANRAASAGRVVKSVKILVTSGPKAARLMANTGRVAAGKSNPLGWILTGAFAVGTLSWFGYKGRNFNLVCYNLLAERHGLSARTDDAVT